MNHKTIALILATTLTLGVLDASAAGRFKARGAIPNASGGYSAASVGGFRGARGASFGGWAAGGDGQGNAAASSGRVFRGPNGGFGGRSGSTMHSADGSTSHHSGAAWQGTYGHGSSNGSFSSDGQGNAYGSRNTRYTTNSGAYYQGDTSVNHSNGSTSLSHHSSCYDAYGNPVSCPRR